MTSKHICPRCGAEGLRDAVYGAAVGDALGVPFEFKQRDSFECTDMVGNGTHHMPAGTFSDDTSMMLATCDSIRMRGRIDVRDMRKRFVSWWRKGVYTVDGACFDIGNTTATALDKGKGQEGGRDTDTTACVAGALAGAAYGYGAIPKKWIEALRGKSIIEDCLF